MKGKTGNKGEWSEIYVLLKLLSEGKLYAADSDLNKLEDIFYPIMTIFREEMSGTTNYNIAENINKIRITDNSGKEIICLPMEQFKSNSEKLLEEIKKKHDKAGHTFSCPSLENFLTSINCNTVAKGGGEKKDIEMQVHDMRTGKNPKLGFSIKSLLGKNSTLFNPGKNTNFKYLIQGIKNIDTTEINKGKPESVINYIKNNEGQLKFDEVCDKNFNSNLILIDSNMPEILAEMLRYKYFIGKSKIKDIITEMVKNNPLKFPDSEHPFYQYKIKNFLTDAALGMTPGKKWTGEYNATGGIIIVKKDGDILCYHIYNRNEFQNYLFNNTKLEQASSGRYDFGKIYTENGKAFINLNLQIRFT